MIWFFWEGEVDGVVWEGEVDEVVWEGKGSGWGGLGRGVDEVVSERWVVWRFCLITSRL